MKILKKFKTLFAISMISGAVLSSFTFADEMYGEKWYECIRTCQGSCTGSGNCFEEIK